MLLWLAIDAAVASTVQLQILISVIMIQVISYF